MKSESGNQEYEIRKREYETIGIELIISLSIK